MKKENKKKKDGTPSRMGEGGGKPLKIPTEEIFDDIVENYFKLCDEKKLIPNKAGLCYALHIDKSTYNDYKKRYPHTLSKTEHWIEQCWIQRLAGNSPTGAIFYLKNAFKEDYKDRHETDITSNGEQLHVYIPTRK